MTNGVAGSLNVGINPDDKATEVVVLLQANASDYGVLQQTNICVYQQDDRGLIIYVRFISSPSTRSIEHTAGPWGFIRSSIYLLQHSTPIPFQVVPIYCTNIRNQPTSIYAALCSPVKTPLLQDSLHHRFHVRNRVPSKAYALFTRLATHTYKSPCKRL